MVYLQDFGCGSGRDIKYFIDQAYKVDAIDGSEEICRIASEYSGIEVKHMYFQELSECEKYDGIWMFKNVNSSKNNKLPDKERYLERFCECQYQAFQVAKMIPKVKKTTEHYLTVKRDIFSIGEDDRGHDAFLQAMKQTVEPLYQIANNQGYGVWWYG